jgi:hypothetical protein
MADMKDWERCAEKLASLSDPSSSSEPARETARAIVEPYGLWAMTRGSPSSGGMSNANTI